MNFQLNNNNINQLNKNIYIDDIFISKINFSLKIIDFVFINI